MTETMRAIKYMNNNELAERMIYCFGDHDGDCPACPLDKDVFTVECLTSLVEEAAIRLLKNGDKEAQWIIKRDKRRYWHECSNCGGRLPLNEWRRLYYSAYCPGCGSRMIDIEQFSEE